ncbi:hypothetical protein GGF32_007746 [Allomyces javanicus]|nr:hypothetical protein GGF32_007746 [Allomyces javanicus]
MAHAHHLASTCTPGDWLLGDLMRSDTVRAFLDKVRQRGNVYVVSNAQMLAWLRNPQPVSLTGAGLPCPGLTAARGPEVCDGLDNDGNGVADDRDATKYLCKCNGTVEGGGWCRDALGSCSIAKTLVNGRYTQCAYNAPAATAGAVAGKTNKDLKTRNAAARAGGAMHGAPVAMFVAVVNMVLAAVVGAL